MARCIRREFLLLPILVLGGCVGMDTPSIESNAWGLSDEQEKEMARQYLSLLPSNLLNGSTIHIDKCRGGLGIEVDPRRGPCEYYVSHTVDGCTWGARVFSACNKDRVCLFQMRPYEKLAECE